MGRKNTYIIATCALIMLVIVLAYREVLHARRTPPGAAGAAPAQLQQAAIDGRTVLPGTGGAGNTPGLALPKAGQSFIDESTGRRSDSGVYAVADAPESLGARQSTLPFVEGGAVFHVVLVSEGRCMEGDMEIIRHAMKNSPGARLLISLEPVVPGAGGVDAFAPLVQEIPLAGLQPGAAFSFLLPPAAAVQHLGLFICKDTLGKNRCSGKETVDLAGKSGLGQQLPGDSAGDQVFYFEYFIRQGNSITAFDNERLLSAGTDFSQFLSRKSDEPAITQQVAEEVLKKNSAVRSISSRLAPDSITVNLPHYERGECMKEGVEFPVEKIKQQLKNKQKQ